MPIRKQGAQEVSESGDSMPPTTPFQWVEWPAMNKQRGEGMDKRLEEYLAALAKQAGVSFSEACKIVIRQINEHHRSDANQHSMVGGNSSIKS